MTRTKTKVATFDRPIPAEGLASFPNRHGVEASIQDERKLQRFWFWTAPRAGIHVLVQAGQVPRTYDLLGAPSGKSLLKDAVRCPFCGSPRVSYPAMTRKNLLPTIAAQVMSALRLMGREYYCEGCQYTWEPVSS